MKKLISFSLWGINPKYLSGALRNAELAKEIYPDYDLRFYVDVLVPEYVNFRLSKNDNVEIVRMNQVGSWESLFWRHYPIDEGEYDVVLFRDTDSRLNYREKSAVEEWLKTDKKTLILKDHPYHNCASLMPGLLGMKKGAIKNLKKKIDKFNKKDIYGVDYLFFDFLYNEIRNDCLIYDEFANKRRYPQKRSYADYSYFVGEVFSSNEEPNEEHRKILIDWEKKFI